MFLYKFENWQVSDNNILYQLNWVSISIKISLKSFCRYQENITIQQAHIDRQHYLNICSIWSERPIESKWMSFRRSKVVLIHRKNQYKIWFWRFFWKKYFFFSFKRIYEGSWVKPNLHSIIGHYNPLIKFTTQILTLLILCVLIFIHE